MPNDDWGHPVGERVSALERGDAETRRNMERVEGKLDEVLAKLGQIQTRIDERRGAIRVGAWVLGVLQMLLGAATAWALSQMVQRHP